ncbi:hypothetical protein AAMO2058_000287000 [Amorphochlora amoebiformis]
MIRINICLRDYDEHRSSQDGGGEEDRKGLGSRSEQWELMIYARAKDEGEGKDVNGGSKEVLDEEEALLSDLFHFKPYHCAQQFGQWGKRVVEISRNTKRRAYKHFDKVTNTTGDINLSSSKNSGRLRKKSKEHRCCLTPLCANSSEDQETIYNDWDACLTSSKSFLFTSGSHLWESYVGKRRLRYVCPLRGALNAHFYEHSRPILHMMNNNTDHVLLVEGQRAGLAPTKVSILARDSGQRLLELDAPGGVAKAVACSKDGYVAVSCWDKGTAKSTLNIWKWKPDAIKTKTCSTRPLFCHRVNGREIRTLEFSSTDSLQLSASGNGYIRILRLISSLENKPLLDTKAERKADVRHHIYLAPHRIAAALQLQIVIFSVPNRTKLQSIWLGGIAKGELGNVLSIARCSAGFITGDNYGHLSLFTGEGSRNYTHRQTKCVTPQRQAISKLIVSTPIGMDRDDVLVIANGLGIAKCSVLSPLDSPAIGEFNVIMDQIHPVTLVSTCDEAGIVMAYAKGQKRMIILDLLQCDGISRQRPTDLQVPREPFALSLHPGGRKVLIGYNDSVILYNIVEGTHTRLMQGARFVLQDKRESTQLVLRWSNGGHMFAIAKNTNLSLHHSVWHTPICALPPPTGVDAGKITDLQFSPDDLLITRVDANGVIATWDIRRARYVQIIQNRDLRIHMVAVDDPKPWCGEKKGLKSLIFGEDIACPALMVVSGYQDEPERKAIGVAKGEREPEQEMYCLPLEIDFQAENISITCVALEPHRGVLLIGTKTGLLLLCKWPPVPGNGGGSGENDLLETFPYACYPVTDGPIAGIYVMPAIGGVLVKAKSGKMMLLQLSRWKHIPEIGWVMADELPSLEGLSVDPDLMTASLRKKENSMLPRGWSGLDGAAMREMSLADRRLLQIELSEWKKMEEGIIGMKSKIASITTDCDFALKMQDQNHAKMVKQIKHQMRKLLQEKDRLIHDLEILNEKESQRSRLKLEGEMMEHEESIKAMEDEFNNRSRALKAQLDRRLAHVLETEEDVRKRLTSEVEEKNRTIEQQERSYNNVVQTLESELKGLQQMAKDEGDNLRENIRQQNEESRLTQLKTQNKIRDLEGEKAIEKITSETRLREMRQRMQECERAVIYLKSIKLENRNQIKTQKTRIRRLEEEQQTEHALRKVHEKRIADQIAELSSLRNQLEMRQEYQAVLEGQVKALRVQQNPLREEIKALSKKLNESQAELFARSTKEIQLKLDGVGQRDVLLSKQEQIRRLELTVNSTERKLKGVLETLRDLIEDTPPDAWRNKVSNFYDKVLRRIARNESITPADVTQEIIRQKKLVEKTVSIQERTQRVMDAKVKQFRRKGLEENASLLDKLNATRREKDQYKRQVGKLSGDLSRQKAAVMILKAKVEGIELPKEENNYNLVGFEVEEDKSIVSEEEFIPGYEKFAKMAHIKRSPSSNEKNWKHGPITGFASDSSTKIKFTTRSKTSGRSKGGTPKGKVHKGKTSLLSQVSKLKRELNNARRVSENCRADTQILLLENSRLQKELNILAETSTRSPAPPVPNFNINLDAYQSKVLDSSRADTTVLNTPSTNQTTTMGVLPIGKNGFIGLTSDDDAFVATRFSRGSPRAQTYRSQQAMRIQQPLATRGSISSMHMTARGDRSITSRGDKPLTARGDRSIPSTARGNERTAQKLAWGINTLISDRPRSSSIGTDFSNCSRRRQSPTRPKTARIFGGRPKAQAKKSMTARGPHSARRKPPVSKHKDLARNIIRITPVISAND